MGISVRHRVGPAGRSATATPGEGAEEFRISEELADGRGEPSGVVEFFVKRQRFFLGLLAVAIVFAAWQITSVTGIVNQEFASYPTQIVTSLISYFHTGTGWSDLWVSAQEFLIGFALSLGIGIPLGILMGWYKTLDGLLNPLVTFLNNTPRIALAPLFVVWFGIGIASKVVIVVTVATVPLIISARVGVVTTERSFVQMARSYGTSNFGLLWKVVLPGSVPAIVAGIRIAIGQGLMGMVLGEFIAADKGIGFELFSAANTLDTARVFDAVAVIAIFGLVLTALATRLERYFDRWRASPGHHN
jgi:ABC-type nitrate/sulfonate/bicarbonate transport system permease component